MRSAEYDEQYTMFLTAGAARPVWPQTPFAAGEVRAMQRAQATLAGIARDLRRTDVHPPLYFWSVELWRRAVGGGLFLARMFSVLCSLIALAAVGVIAWVSGIPPALAMLLTLGCYGFAYTGAIARGFALAQMLSVGGVALLLAARGRRRWEFAAGASLGAATATNYLAAFVAVGAVIVHAAHRLPRRHGTKPPMTTDVGAGVALFFPLDLYFFLAQRNSRAGQFPPFHMLHSLLRLAGYAAANVTGGLPLYAVGAVRGFLVAILGLFTIALAVCVVLRWRRIAAAAHRQLLGVATVAPPIGLLLLGAAFHTTPIELRYLAFAVPFAATLLAGALSSLSHRVRHVAVAAILAVQCAALSGLLARQETMQPARAAAAAAAVLVQGGVVVLPRGDDGVGIVGAFAIEAPTELRLLVVSSGEPQQRVLARLNDTHRVVLAVLPQDNASRAIVSTLRATFVPPCWRRVARGFSTIAYEFACAPGSTK